MAPLKMIVAGQASLDSPGCKIAEAIDYSAWKALTRHIDDGGMVADNNLIERQIKP
ncbi:IS66 family transposase [Variovorax boronicumulans]